MGDKIQDVNEAGLSRLWHDVQNYDCAILTAWRKEISDCVYGCELPVGYKLTYADKHKRNKELLANLIEHGYGVISIDGSYIEGYGSESEKECKENSFFVSNERDSDGFAGKIIHLGKLYCQDSVLIKPKESEEAYLYGTNHATFPGLDDTVPCGIFRGGRAGKFMSRVKGRPFKFESKDNYNVMTRGYILGPLSDSVDARIQTMLDHLAKG